MVDFQKTKEFFHIPKGLTYLCGNSLGPLPRNLPTVISNQLNEEWGQLLIGGWNKAGWMELSSKIGNRIGNLIGAPEGTTIMGDTLSIKVFQALGAALKLNPDRKIILTDAGNFPSDVYIAKGLAAFANRDYKVKIVDTKDIFGNMNENVAVLLLTEVDYKTGERFESQNITLKAKSKGIITVWDLAHTVGAVTVDMQQIGADFAVGCTYKYLNGGPGSPAFIYINPDLISLSRSPITGWLGHANPFGFTLDYEPASTIKSQIIGTPPVISLSILNFALDIWDEVSLEEVYAKSMELSELFIAGIKTKCPEMTVMSPENPAKRGSHVALGHPESYPLVRFLTEQSVICDYREPGILRFGIAPLYNDAEDIMGAVEVLAEALEFKPWKFERYQSRSYVT